MSDWNSATSAVNLWRGELIHWFTRGEATASNTLLALAAVEERGSRVRLRQLLGQRLEDLHAALAADGPFAAEGKGADADVAAFREHQAIRSALCHGVTKVLLDRNGRWAVNVEILSFARGKEDRTSLFFTHRDAEKRLKDLRVCCQRMESTLGKLRAAIGR